MPILFLGSGLVLVITGLKGNPVALWNMVEGDFVGKNNFIYWMVAILALGSLGYVDSLKNLSRLFIALVVIVLLVHNQGFFAQLQAFINSGSKPAPTSGVTQ